MNQHMLAITVYAIASSIMLMCLDRGLSDPYWLTCFAVATLFSFLSFNWLTTVWKQLVQAEAELIVVRKQLKALEDGDAEAYELSKEMVQLLLQRRE